MVGIPEHYYPARQTGAPRIDRPDDVPEYRPVEASAITDEPRLCFDPVNVLWVRHILGALHDLTDFRIWKGTDSEKRHAVQQIEHFLNSLKACEVCEPEPCPECPDPEPEQPGTGGGSGGCDFGMTGLSVHELEMIVMSCITDIRFSGGKLQVKYFGCCDWVDVLGLNGSISVSGALAEGLKSLDDWIADGAAPIAPIENIPNENPYYTTLDSLKCAKATAIVEEFWNVIGGIREMIEEDFGNSIPSFGGIISIGAGWLNPWLLLGGFGLALAGFLVKFAGDVSGFTDALEAVENDTAKKQELICDLVDRMVPPVRIGALLWHKMTGDDVRIAIERFEDIVSDGMARDLLGIFPIQGWMDTTGKKVTDTECGCETYLPYTPPPTPPTPPDVDWYDHFRLSSKTGTGSSWVWSAATGTAQAADTTSSSAIEFTKSFPVVASQPKVAKTGKSLFIEILTRGGTVVGSLPPQEGGINVSFEFGNEDGGGSATLYASSFYNTVGLVEIPLEPVFEGWGGSFDNVALRSIGAKFQYWMDSGESVSLGIGRIEIADSTT